MSKEEKAYIRIQLTLSEVEAERNTLRAEVQAQRQQLLVTTDRLRTLEQLFQTIQAGRAYKLLRRLGRWKWVEQTLGQLPRQGEPTTQPSALNGADEMTAPDVLGLSHNIPKVLPASFSHVAAFRIRNIGSAPVYLPAEHTLFWAAAAPAQHHTIDVNLDGQFLLNAQVRGDCIRPGESTSIFFPLHSGVEGGHRLQILMAPRAAMTQAEGDCRTLFDIAYRVNGTAATLGPLARLRHFVFMLLFADLPMLASRFLCRYARALFRLAGETDRRSVHLRRWKDENRQLAFMEKQTRKQRVASLPCYLTIDTTVQCNLRCPLCFRQYVGAAGVPQAEGDMPSDVMDEIIRTLLPTAYTISTSSCGEPLLSPHLDKLLEACKRFEVFLSFTTNGTLLNKKGLLDRLIPVLHRLEISFDSANPEMFERLRAGARFEHVLRNARALGQIRSSLPDPKFSLGFSMTLYRENLEEIPDVLRIVADCGGNFLRTDIGVIFSKSNLHHSVLHCPEAYNDAYAKAHQCARDLRVSLLMRPPFVEGGESEATRYGVCDHLYTHACVASDGSFKPCFSTVIPGRRGAATQNLRSLWNNKDMRGLRSEHDTERAHELCKKCYMTLQGRDSMSKRRDLFLRGDAAVASAPGAVRRPSMADYITGTGGLPTAPAWLQRAGLGADVMGTVATQRGSGGGGR